MSFRTELITVQKTRYANYLAAEEKILRSQEYAEGTREMKYAMLKDVAAEMEKIQNKILQLESGGIRVKTIIPRPR